MEDKLIYNGWLKVYNREVNGKIYDIVKQYDAVSAILLNEFNEILLVKQFRPSVMKETLEIPAGCRDIEGESKEKCLVRELKEETGLDIKEEELEWAIDYNPIMGFSNSTMSIFKVSVKKSDLKSKKIIGDDVTEVLWMPFEEFEKNIKEGKIYDSKTVMSFFYLK